MPLLNASIKCNVYAVETSPDKKKATKITEDGGNLRSFLNRNSSSDRDFVINQQGCQNGFSNMYIYRENGKGIYSSDLQEEDGYANRGTNRVDVSHIISK